MAGAQRGKTFFRFGWPVGGPFRFAGQQMDVIRHNHITHHHESVTLTNLFKNLQEQIPTPRRCEPRLAMVTTASEKVEILLPVITLQAFRHALNCNGISVCLEYKCKSKA
jgi:hypothetical protein